MDLEEAILLPMQLQAAEVARVIQESADFELANQMQLDEVLAVSLAMAVASSRSLEQGSTSTESKSQEDGCESGELSGDEVCPTAAPSDDRKTALSEQQLEAEKLKQEMDDELEALKEQSYLVEINAIAEHDSRFARFLSSLPEGEWEAIGDNLHDPFTFRSEDVKEAIVQALPRICEEAPRLKRKAILLDNDEGTSYHRSENIWEPAVAAAALLDLTQTTYLATISGKVCEGDSESADNENGLVTCKICLTTELTPSNSAVISEKCLHSFCIDCLRQHGETVVKSGKTCIRCPYFHCEEVWSAAMCQRFLSSNSFLIFTQRQIENAFPESERVYCPFEDCSALQLKPAIPGQPCSSQHATIRGVECLSCHRYFCLECQVPWHTHVTCDEYQAMPLDERSPLDIALLKGLAKEKKWQRCTCGFLVELRAGCNHIVCRCGKQFCYICGGHWKANDHTCKTCCGSNVKLTERGMRKIHGDKQSYRGRITKATRTLRSKL